MQENQVIGIQKTPNAYKNSYNKLEKVSKRDKKKEKKLTKKLSPDEGVTKWIRDEDHLRSVSKLIRLPSKRKTTDKQEPVSTRKHSRLESRSNTQGRESSPKRVEFRAASLGKTRV